MKYPKDKKSAVSVAASYFLNYFLLEIQLHFKDPTHLKLTEIPF